MGLPDLTRLAFAYAVSFGAYWTGMGPRPFSAAYAVTNRCNLRCAYCNTPFMDPTDLPLEQVRNLFDRLQRMGVSRLGLVGGEPLLRKDIGEVVAEAKSRRFYVTFNSNLVLYARRPEVFDDVDLVFTSLDGDPATHRDHRGERSLDGVLEAIEALVARRKPVVAICVVGEADVPQAERLVEQAEKIGFQMHFQPQCLDTEIVRGDLGAHVQSQDLRRFWAGLLDLKRAGRAIASSVPYLEVQSRWEDFGVSAFHDPSVRCAAGRGFLYVDPQGRGYPCAYTKGKAEPIDLLREDWKSAFPGTTPCTVCNVGPMLEFNLLFQRPFSATADALRRIA